MFQKHPVFPSSSYLWKMVVCKFFLQGNCKYGTYCNFEHQIPGKYSYTNYDNTQKSTSILRQSTFGTQNASTVTPNSENNPLTMIKLVAQDMLTWEKGGQWLLSYYAPFKGKPSFPGFEDYSPEEIRFGLYEAVKAGTLETYQLQELMQNAAVKVKALQNPSGEIMSVLQGLHITPIVNTEVYGQNSNGNIFGSSGGTLVQTGGSSSVFGQQQSNVFAQSSNIFSSTAAPQGQNENIFGAAANTQNNVFAPSTNIFASNPQPTFVPQPQQSANIFSQNSSTSNIFSSPTETTNMFPTSTPQPNNVFGTPNNANSVANQSPMKLQLVSGAQNAPPSYSATIFGSVASNQPTTPFGLNSSTSQVNTAIYSKPEELTKEEIQWFESVDLDIYNIPDKPPTYEMCFAK
ncbi:nucleoporin NUP42-like isoform X2 [Euwallacea fornicatus]|uniref:nucleoporin NUP42-like isoform X2 n=1 Tax=Euwallacea fornicatus TaxID=995702 RepID=UPI00338F87B9